MTWWSEGKKELQSRGWEDGWNQMLRPFLIRDHQDATAKMAPELNSGSVEDIKEIGEYVSYDLTWVIRPVTQPVMVIIVGSGRNLFHLTKSSSPYVCPRTTSYRPHHHHRILPFWSILNQFFPPHLPLFHLIGPRNTRPRLLPLMFVVDDLCFSLIIAFNSFDGNGISCWFRSWGGRFGAPNERSSHSDRLSEGCGRIPSSSCGSYDSPSHIRTTGIGSDDRVGNCN